MEVFAKPGVAAIIEKTEKGKRYLLVQERQKENGGIENGMTEIPAGKIREYESVFDTLRREIREETGLTITSIQEEDQVTSSNMNGYETISWSPFMATQNLSGGYSIILHTFLCRAEGTIQIKTDETANVRWEPAEAVEAMLAENPEQFYPMHLNALKKYFSIKR